ncbi:hypothetical protein F5Y03DRAFT_405496 [Xylaria venustula]|nr:hypothetical protein F5Y03DRAFT_405496 [Xylaria venustula]
MSPNKAKQQSEPKGLDVSLFNGRFAHKPEEVEKSLEAGLNPNIQWDQAEVEGRRQRGGGGRSYNPEKSWANYNTPIHMSVQLHQLDTAAILLKHGAQIDHLNALGRTPLHEAIFGSDTEAIKFLIENGADLNARTEARSFDDFDMHRSGISGILPLHEAIRTWNSEAAELLVAGGADITKLSPDGWTFLDLALLERNELITNLLYRHGARFSDFDVPENTFTETGREMAQALLEDRSIFPPSTFRAAYLDIIRHPDFLASLAEYSSSPEPDCSGVFGTFFSLLSSIAEKPNPENIPGAPKCDQCVLFIRRMSPPMSAPFKLHPDRDSLIRSAQEGCCLCAIFEDALVHHCGRWAHPDKPLQEVANSSAVFLTSKFSIFSISITVHCESQREALEVYALSDSFLIDQQLFPDNATLETASPRAFKTARAWLDNCQHHHLSCGKEDNANSVLPTRVIDVGDGSIEPCLYIGNGECAAYLALSYCRSPSNDIVTTKESLQNHMEAIKLSSLPPTLHDAILATRQLGFRYLWVDVLCIIQDDADDWERETQHTGAIYANATVTLSAHDSEDFQGGLYRPRQNRVTSPVQISLRVPKMYQKERHTHQTNYYVLPVHGEKQLFSPGPVNNQAWTLQEQVLSTRILHWGPGILYWECLSCHGSESDPEGRTHPYNSSCTDFMDVRRRKRVIQGRAKTNDLSYHPWMGEEQGDERDDSNDSDEGSESPSEELAEEAVSRLNSMFDEENQSPENEGGVKDEEDVEDENTQTNDEPNLKKITYLEWQKLVSQYSSRTLAKSTDKVPGFLGLSQMIAKTLEDESIVGVWKKSHFLPSLLWAATKPGGRLRSQNYPSWTWASVDGKVHYPVDLSRIRWEPSVATMDVQVSGYSQNHATGSITLRSTLRKFPEDFKFWRYENQLLNPLMTYTFGRSRAWVNKSAKELQEQLTVVEGFRDLRVSSPQAEQAGGWEGAGDDISFLVIARVGAGPPPSGVGYPAFFGGRPKSLVCLCLTPARQADLEAERKENVFRRVGLCHFWDEPIFWKGAKKEELVTII